MRLIKKFVKHIDRSVFEKKIDLHEGTNLLIFRDYEADRSFVKIFYYTELDSTDKIDEFSFPEIGWKGKREIPWNKYLMGHSLIYFKRKKSNLIKAALPTFLGLHKKEKLAFIYSEWVNDFSYFLAGTPEQLLELNGKCGYNGYLEEENISAIKFPTFMLTNILLTLRIGGAIRDHVVKVSSKNIKVEVPLHNNDKGSYLVFKGETTDPIYKNKYGEIYFIKSTDFEKVDGEINYEYDE